MVVGPDRLILGSTKRLCKFLVILTPSYADEFRNTIVTNDEPDGWVFDTVKAATVATRKNTTKRRKLSAIHGNGQLPEEAFKMLDLKDAPLDYSSPPPMTVKKRTVRKQQSGVQMNSSPRARQVSSQKQPLQPDMSFGNTASTVRVFRRVSDNSIIGQASSESGSVVDENAHANEIVTKETLLGHQVYQKVIDPTFQELHAQTGNQAKREALSKLADAWAALDAVDSEGGLQLMKSLMERIRQDSKLSSLLLRTKDSNPATPQKPKLVLAQSNPHLRSHRRRQSSVVEEPKDRLHNLPGQAVAGMEHTKQLADVLYTRWADGMRKRWPAI